MLVLLSEFNSEFWNVLLIFIWFLRWNIWSYIVLWESTEVDVMNSFFFVCDVDSLIVDGVVIIELGKVRFQVSFILRYDIYSIGILVRIVIIELAINIVFLPLILKSNLDPIISMSIVLI